MAKIELSVHASTEASQLQYIYLILLLFGDFILRIYLRCREPLSIVYALKWDKNKYLCANLRPFITAIDAFLVRK